MSSIQHQSIDQLIKKLMASRSCSFSGAFLHSAINLSSQSINKVVGQQEPLFLLDPAFNQSINQYSCWRVGSRAVEWCLGLVLVGPPVPEIEVDLFCEEDREVHVLLVYPRRQGDEPPQ